MGGPRPPRSGLWKPSSVAHAAGGVGRSRWNTSRWPWADFDLGVEQWRCRGEASRRPRRGTGTPAIRGRVREVEELKTDARRESGCRCLSRSPALVPNLAGSAHAAGRRSQAGAGQAGMRAGFRVALSGGGIPRGGVMDLYRVRPGPGPGFARQWAKSVGWQKHGPGACWLDVSGGQGPSYRRAPARPVDRSHPRYTRQPGRSACSWGWDRGRVGA